MLVEATMIHSQAAEAKQPIPISKAPGHWVLARLGKRVLRPGGVELTTRMLDALAVSPADHVIELAPGIGHTARRVLDVSPASYYGVDKESTVVAELQRTIVTPNCRFVQGCAEDTGLPGEIATIVFGEAVLSMQAPNCKRRIVREARRLLRPGGRYGIHELCIHSPEVRPELEAELSRAIHHGVRLLTPAEWSELLECAGFRVIADLRAPMHLLEPPRVLRDEGVIGSLRIAVNMLRSPEARRRVLAMRKLFHKYEKHMQAISLVAEKQ
jgi:ubiquinone/menaquinone biosynthesis C-methylase UbiE